MRRNLSKYLKMSYFATGQAYEIPADILRVEAIENSIDIAMKITGGGVLSGWQVYQDRYDSVAEGKRFQVKISEGSGIIKFYASASGYKHSGIADEYPSLGNEIVYQNAPPDPHYIGIKTGGTIDLPNPSIGKNRISAIYITMSSMYIRKFEEILNISRYPYNLALLNESITINSVLQQWQTIKNLKNYYDEVVAVVVPDPSASPSSGLYRNLIPEAASDFPVHYYSIEGPPSNINSNEYTLFVNGKEYANGQSFGLYGNDKIYVYSPLSKNDHVTLKISPKYGILLAEIETNESGILKINNNIRSSVYETMGDSLVYKYIDDHQHDGSGGYKILLTTDTSIMSLKSIDRVNFFVEKTKFTEKYGFEFIIGTYYTEVYLNGFLCEEQYTVSEKDGIIIITFKSEIDVSNNVTVKFVVNHDYIQIQGKISTNSTNSSKEKIDVELDARNVSSGIIPDEMIPTISHYGIKDYILKPCNPVDHSAEYVHRTESFNIDDNLLKEYFPVLGGKTNARNAMYMTRDFFQNVIYACAAGDILTIDKVSSNYLSQDVVGDYPYSGMINNNKYSKDFCDGWVPSSINGKRDSITRKEFEKTSEYDEPFKIQPVINSFSGGRRMFVFTHKYILSSSYDHATQTNLLKEVINLTDDYNALSNNEIINLEFGFSNIVDSAGARSLLHDTDYTFYFLGDDNKVYFYDYSYSKRKNSIYDMTVTPLWSNANKVFSVRKDGYDFVFVSDNASAGNGYVYINYLSSYGINTTLNKKDIKLVFSNDHTDISPLKGFQSGQKLILITEDLNSEKRTLASSISANNTYFYIDPINQKNFTGKQDGYYNSVVIKEWEKITGSDSIGKNFGGEIKKVLYAYSSLFVVTNNKVFSADVNGWTFNGTSDYKIISDSDTLKPTGPFSVSAWFYKDATETRQTIFQSYDQIGDLNAGRSLYGITLDCIGSGRYLRFFIGSGSTSVTCTTASGIYSDNEYHFVVGTWDGEYLKLYVDGILRKTIASSTPPIYAESNKVRIGCFDSTGGDHFDSITDTRADAGPAYFFKGYLSNVALINRSLSYEEIYSYYINKKDKHSISGNVEMLISDCFTNLTWHETDISSIGSDVTDFAATNDRYYENWLFISTVNGVYRGVFDYIYQSVSFSKSENQIYGLSLNSMLSNINSIYVDNKNLNKDKTTVYLCGKYGIFKSSNFGETWRNTSQILGHPENKSFCLPKQKLKIVGKNESKNRLYVFDFNIPLGYGWGYGAGEGIDYFNVMEPNYISSGYGFGVDSFESEYVNSYGYGYGQEIFNPLEGLEVDDWVYTGENYVSSYKNIPLRITGMGIDPDNALYYIDIEEFNGDFPYLSNIVPGYPIEVFSKTKPLAYINGSPQSSLYGSTNVVNYYFDYYRQSITFDAKIKADDHVEIVSRYLCYTPMDSLNLSKFTFVRWEREGYAKTLADNLPPEYAERVPYNVSIVKDNQFGASDGKEHKLYLKLNGNLVSGWTQTGNLFILNRWDNIDHLFKVSSTGLMVGNTGGYSHAEIEDKISVYDTGLSYEMDGVRASNFLSMLAALQYQYNISGSEYYITGNVESVFDDGASSPYFYDNSNVFPLNELSGKSIVFSVFDGVVYKEKVFTIQSNTSNKITIHRATTYRHYTLYQSEENVLNEKTLTFYFDAVAISSTINVLVNGTVFDGWSYLPDYNDTIGISLNYSLTDFFNTDVDVWISFVDKTEYIKFTDVISVNDSYSIKMRSSGIFDSMRNIEVASYSVDSNLLDLNYCYIENKLAEKTVQNDSVGDTTLSVFNVYYDPSSDILYAGTNNGVWARTSDMPVFQKTSPLLQTINATGDIPVPLNVNGAYVQFDFISKIWTVTWGGGSQTKDENSNLTSIRINSIAICPSDSNLILASSNTGVYQSENAGDTWDCVWDTISDSRTRQFPKIAKLVFDDKHPWTVNAVHHSGLFRSYNYGDKWEKVVNGDISEYDVNTYGAFAYSIDNSDSRSTYFFCQNSFKYKHELRASGFYLPNSYTGDIEFSKEVFYRKGKTGERISNIVNDINDVSNIYMTSEYSGVLWSYLFGYLPDTYRTQKNNYFSSFFTSSVSAGVLDCEYNGSRRNNDSSGESTYKYNYFPTATMVKSQAFGEMPVYGIGEYGYSVFVDKINRKIYVSLLVSESDRGVPKDGELVGFYFNFVFGNKKIYRKIIGNYDRGYKGDYQYTAGFYGEYIGSKRVEVVLDGILSKDDFVGNSDYFFEEPNGDYSVFRLNESGYNRSCFWSFVGERNGYSSEIDLGNLGIRVYSVKDYCFNDNFELENILILDFDAIGSAPSFMKENGVLKDGGIDLLKDYIIGEYEQGYKYKILNSKILDQNSLYYYDKTNDVSNRIQYVCKIADVDGQELTDLNNPINLWFRMDCHELNTPEPFVCKMYNGDEEICPVQFSRMYHSVFFSSTLQYEQDYGYGFGYGYGQGQYGYGAYTRENVIFVAVDHAIGEDGSYDEVNYKWTLSDSGLIGKYIGHSKTNKKYMIVSAIKVTQNSALWGNNIWSDYDNNYDFLDNFINQGYTNKTLYMLRVSPYSRSYSDNIHLFSPSVVTASGSNYVEISQIGDMADNSLIGFYLKNKNYHSIFKIESNIGNKIVLDNSNIENLFAENDKLEILYNVIDKRAYDVAISNNIIYLAAANMFYLSEDKGLKWKPAITGLDINSTSNMCKFTFNQIKIVSNKLYASTSTVNYGGVWCLDISTLIWSKLIGNDEDLTTYGVNGIDAVLNTVYAATSKGVYKHNGSLWSNLVFPEEDVTAVVTINNDPNYQPIGFSNMKNDLDRIYIGTDGRGLYKREKINQYSRLVNNRWERNVSDESTLPSEIIASQWYVRDVNYYNGNYYISSLSPKYMGGNSAAQKNYHSVNSGIAEYPNMFDWEKQTQYIYLTSGDKAYLSIDPSNFMYLTTMSDLVVNGNSSPQRHNLLDYICGSVGYGRGNKTAISGSGMSQINITRNNSGIYETPFNHLPNRSSITCIKAAEYGAMKYLIFGTDRNGVWRSNRARYSLPAFDGGSTYGYPFDYNKFQVDDIKASVEGIISYGSVRRYRDSIVENGNYSRWDFHNLTEKFYLYVLYSGNDGYEGVSIHGENLIGGYFVVSQDIQNNTGVDIVTKIFEISDVHIASGSIYLKLTAGKHYDYSRFRNMQFTSKLARWETDAVSADGYKWCILDFPEYENISNGLPFVDGWKNSIGENECGAFVRDISIYENHAVIACGMNGIYYSDLSADVVSWSEITYNSQSFDSDATCIFSNNYNGISGELYIGTWGNGVYKKEVSGDFLNISTTALGNLNHKNIWTIHLSSSETKLYVGTEHGGIYSYNTITPAWVREGVGESLNQNGNGEIIRSGIFSWDVVGVPVNKGGTSNSFIGSETGGESDSGTGNGLYLHLKFNEEEDTGFIFDSSPNQLTAFASDRSTDVVNGIRHANYVYVEDRVGMGKSIYLNIDDSALSTNAENGHLLMPINGGAHVKILDSPKLNKLYFQTSFSISAWVKTTFTDKQVIFQVYEGRFNSRTEYGYMLWLNRVNAADGGDQGQVNFTFIGGINCSTTQKVNDGDWRHIVALWNGTYMKIYIDGAQVSEIESPSPPAYNVGYMGVRIGCEIASFTEGGGLADSHYFMGQIDDLRVYNKALSQSEISFIYNGGAGREDYQNVVSVVTPSTGIQHLSYSQNQYLLAYSWGGGIMLKRGADKWEQFNNGLQNMYVQKVSICGGDFTYADGDPIVAYAATCGGGVFRNANILSANSEWLPLPAEGLPGTLNVDSVVVGVNANIIYVNVRVNDLAGKNMPLHLRAYSGVGCSPIGGGTIWPYLNGDAEINILSTEQQTSFHLKQYLPLAPYTRGTRKNVVYRGGYEGTTWKWSVAFDKDTGERGFSSIVYGLSIVPGTATEARFIYRYANNIKTYNIVMGYVEYHDEDDFVLEYVSLTGGTYSSKIFSESNKLSLLKSSLRDTFNGSLYTTKDIALSIDPIDKNTVYLSTMPKYFGYYNDRYSGNFAILRSDNDGVSWGNITPADNHLTNEYFVSGFNSDIQISTKNNYIIIISNANECADLYYDSVANHTAVRITDTVDSDFIGVTNGLKGYCKAFFNDDEDTGYWIYANAVVSGYKTLFFTGNIVYLISPIYKIKILCDRCIYTNINNAIYASVNKGISWSKISFNEDFVFGTRDIRVKGVVNNPLSTVSDVTVHRSKYILVEYLGETRLYQQNDEHWYNIISVAINNINPNSLLDDCLSMCNKTLYISCIDKIYKIVINDDVLLGSSIPAQGVSIFVNAVGHIIQHPLTISEYDSNYMCYVCDDNLYFTDIGGFDASVGIPLSGKFGGDDIQKLIIGTGSALNRKKEFFACVKKENDKSNISYNVLQVLNTEDEYNSFMIDESSTAGIDVDDIVLFENNDKILPYSSRVKKIVAAGQVELLGTKSGQLIYAGYDSKNQKTIIRLSINFTDYESYVGTSFVIFNSFNRYPYVFNGGKYNIGYFEITFQNDLTNSISSGMYFRIGEIFDIIYPEIDFTGNVIINKIIPSLANGLWYSQQNGQSLIRVNDLFIGADKKYYSYGCDNAFIFDNGAVAASMSKNNISKIMINDDWLPSENIGMLVNDTDGRIIASTNNGIIKLNTRNNLDFFEFNYISDNITGIFRLANGEYYVKDSLGNLHSISNMFRPGKDITTETITLNNGEINAVINTVKNNKTIYWIATTLGLVIFINDKRYIYFQGDDVTSIIADGYGNVYGTNSINGVFFISYNISNSGALTVSIKSDYNVPGTVVHSVCSKYGMKSEVNSAFNYLKISWENNSAYYAKSILLKSSSQDQPYLYGTTNFKSPVYGSISEVVSENADINGQSVPCWKISIYPEINYVENYLVGMYIYPDPKNSEGVYLIEKSANKYIYINKYQNGGYLDSPSPGNNFSVYQKIGASYVVSVSAGFSNVYVDNNLYVGAASESYFHLLKYNDSQSVGVFTDYQKINIEEDSKYVMDNSEILAISDSGLYKIKQNSVSVILPIQSDDGYKRLFLDSTNRLWVSGGSKLGVLSGNDFNVYTYRNMQIDTDVVFRHVSEGLDSNIYISTNKGLVVKWKLNDVFSVYRENDFSYRVYRDASDKIKTDKWRISAVVEGESAIFAKENNDSSHLYLYNQYASCLVDNKVYSTINFGSSWANTSSTDTKYRYYLPIYSRDNSYISGYHLSLGNNYKYMLSSVGNRSDHVLYKENGLDMSILDSTAIGSPSSIYLSESSEAGTFSIYAGIYNSVISSNEVEIVNLAFSTNSGLLNASSCETYGASSGLSIQSVYCISEYVSDGKSTLYAGGKNNIYIKNIDSLTDNSWRILPISISNNSVLNDSIYGSYFLNTSYTIVPSPNVFTKICISENSSNDRIVYAARTYLNPQYLDSGKDDRYVVAFNIGKDDELGDGSVFGYDLSSSFVDRYSSHIIYNQEDNVHMMYNPQKISKTVFNGHLGAICFSDNNLFVGGFDNSILYIPFIDFNDGVRGNVAINSGRRSSEKTGLPLTDEMPYFNDVSPKFTFWESFNDLPTSFDDLLRPRSSWCVNFVNSTQGYASLFSLGQNTDKINHEKTRSIAEVFYKNIQLHDSSLFVKTNDMGMVWQPYFNSRRPGKDAAFSGAVEIDKYLVLSSIYGTAGNCGIFAFDTESGDWSDLSTRQIPVKGLKKISDTVYVMTSGSGVYTVDSELNYEPLSSRYVTQYGLGLNRWNITQIQEDPQNKDKKYLMIGTKKHGILKTTGAHDIRNALWNLDEGNAGLPYGEITDFKMLSVNNYIVLAGVKNCGLYRKDRETKKYNRIISNLPIIGNVRQIEVDDSVKEVYCVVYLDISVAYYRGMVLVLRSMNKPPIKPASNSFNYFVGDSVIDSEVIFIGYIDGFNGIFKDSSKTLKDGKIYYYAFYKINTDGNNYSYSDVSPITGLIQRKGTYWENKYYTFYINTMAFAGINLSGRIVDLDPLQYNIYAQKYRIISNTGNSFTVEFDPDRMINNSGWHEPFEGRRYSIGSVFSTMSITSNPIYVVYKEGVEGASGIGSIYSSYNNGVDWQKLVISDVELGGSVDVVSINISPFSDALYAATKQSIYKTINGGIEWEIISTDLNTYNGVNKYFNGLPNLYSEDYYLNILFDDQNKNLMYAVTFNGDFYRTINNAENWNLVSSNNIQVNGASIVSDFTNSIYFGTTGSGILKFEDPIRDYMTVNIDSDAQLTYFDFQYLEMGDKYFTDNNSIIMSTVSLNDDASDTREEIKFSVSDDTKYVSFKFAKNNSFLFASDIHIGEEDVHPVNNPFVLQNPVNPNNDMVIKSIGDIDGGIYALTSFGAYITTNQGDKWVSIKSASLPQEIYGMSSYKSGAELVFATENGLWITKNNKTDFNRIESKNKKVRAVWKSDVMGKEYIYRGGEEGLFVTLKNANSITLYSGITNSEFETMFCWGDPFEPKDGNWSNGTLEIQKQPIVMEIGNNAYGYFVGWDGALIVRQGPHDTYEEAIKEYDQIWAPDIYVGYPLNGDGGTSYKSNTGAAVFSLGADKRGCYDDLRAARRQNEKESSGVESWMGDKYNAPPNRTLIGPISNKNIIIGNITNRRIQNSTNQVSEYYKTKNMPFDSGVSTVYPIVDRITDMDAADSRNKFYNYKIYPYVFCPDPAMISTDGNSRTYPCYPYYNPSNGDTPDAYTYILPIKKFFGSKYITCGVSLDDNANWVIGTDNGIYFSTEMGLDVQRAMNVAGYVSSISVTSSGVVIASISVGDGLVSLVKSNYSEIDNLTKKWIWSPIEEANALFYKCRINKIFNFTEYQGQIYAATNKGIFNGGVDGSNWYLWGKVGDHESLAYGKLLGQSFKVD